MMTLCCSLLQQLASHSLLARLAEAWGNKVLIMRCGALRLSLNRLDTFGHVVIRCNALLLCKNQHKWMRLDTFGCARTRSTTFHYQKMIGIARSAIVSHELPERKEGGSNTHLHSRVHAILLHPQNTTVLNTKYTPQMDKTTESSCMLHDTPILLHSVILLLRWWLFQSTL